METAPLQPHDTVHPFLIDHSSIRGKVVRLGDTVDTILSRHAYPEPVSRLLAEMIVLSAMLSTNLKGVGILTVQLKGDGPIRFMVVDADAKGEMRGYAQMVEDGEARIAALPGKPTMRDLVGSGYLAITLDQGAEPYQGIVELSGETLTETIEHYFTNSEQCRVKVKVAVGKNHLPKHGSHWCAGGILIQHVPHEGGTRQDGSNVVHFEDEPPTEQWNRASIFVDTVEDFELLDPFLPPQQLLFRLFNEDGVWVYDPSHIHVGCRCSRDKIQNALLNFPQDEIVSMADNGKIEVNCQFCNQQEDFTLEQLDQLYAESHSAH